jgi:hypothetical protein
MSKIDRLRGGSRKYYAKSLYIGDYIRTLTTNAWFDGKEDVRFVGSDEVILLRVFDNVSKD